MRSNGVMVNGVSREEGYRLPVAVVGIGLRVAGASSPGALWELLCDGVDATGDIPSTRWDMGALHDPSAARPGTMRSRRAALLDDVHMVDPAAFRLTKRELRQMDPQHRVLLEAAWFAFEDAGIPLDELRGSRTGVFAGINFSDFQRLLTRDWSAIDGYAVLGTTPSFAANRISYAFDLRGPSTCVSVGCASSTTALHEACRSLALGEVDLAIAGGVELMLSPDGSILLSQAGVLSANGQCRTLDAAADGYVRGEGACMVVLKPLAKVDASDRVYAVIRGSAVNHNGRNDWIMAPSERAQADVISEASARGGVSASSIDYVDLHGSAFLKGDALEAAAIARALGDPAARPPCRLGAISNNLGYLGAAGGAAQLIKVCLSLHHRVLPPTIHVDVPNPQIAFEELGLQVQTRLAPWPERESGEPRRAGVISTSLGGSNAFIVLEAAPDTAADDRASHAAGVDGESRGFVLVVSAHTGAALERRVLAFGDFLREGRLDAAHSGHAHSGHAHSGHAHSGHAHSDGALTDICYTAAFKRQHHAHRAAFLARDRRGLVAQLDRFVRGSARALFAEEGTPEELLDVGRIYVAEGRVLATAMPSAGGRCVSLPVFPFQRQTLWPEWLTVAEVSRGPMEGRGREPAQNMERAASFEIRSIPAHRREERLVRFLREQVAEVLELDVERVDTRAKTLFELGLTSVGVVLIAHRIARTLGVDVTPTTLFELPRIELLSSWLLERLAMESEPARDEGAAFAVDGAPAHGGDDDDFVRAIAQLSDQEARDLIAQKLQEISLEVES
ncbi:beta-ketoacyl synthase N-terminal-like domain-containing protein [Pendulispora albinea]|uniref:Phosphopantetheine-binding protein n=1 Tax=Pendulispora albinea TaxID=2741071 RepID=A0ABZ2M434_9BACT